MTLERPIRSTPIVLYVGVGSNLPPEPGRCTWCGEAIVLRDPGDYRRARRVRHRGDRYEEGSRNCDALERRGRLWSARDVIKLRGDSECVDCGSTSGAWDADHDVPLADGGPHCATNIVRRCVPCHKRKTAREAAARAGRRGEARRQLTLERLEAGLPAWTFPPPRHRSPVR